MNIATRLISTAAALSITFVPIAAQASTRASDNDVIYTGSTQTLPLSDGDDDEDAGLIDLSDVLVAILAGAWVTGIIFIIAEDDNQSPGGN